MGFKNIMKKVVSLLVVVSVLVGCSTKTSGYEVLIQDLQGKVFLTHNDEKTRVNTHIVLEDKDRIDVAQESSTLVSFAQDTYVYVEELTSFQVGLQGDAKQYQTQIQLEQGAMLVELQQDLGKDCSFVIQTNKAKVICDRGVFYVQRVKEDKKAYTYIYALSNDVSVQADKKVVVKSGTVVKVDEQSGKFVKDHGKLAQAIQYEQLPLETLIHLQDIEKTSNLSNFTLADLEQWIAAYDDESEFEVSVDFNTGEVQQPSKDDTKPSRPQKPTVHKPSTKPEVNSEIKPEQPNKDEVGNKPQSEDKPSSKPETKPEQKPSSKPETKPEVKPEVKPETKPEVKPDPKPETKPETKPEANPQNPIPQPSPSDRPIPHDDFDKWKDGHDPFVYDVNYASTGGHPNDGFFGEWGQYFPTRKSADAWLLKERKLENSEFAEYFLVIHENVDGSARILAFK